MVKKKRVKKRPIRKKVVSAKSPKLVSKYGSKLALRDFILFAVLSLLFYILNTISGNEIYQDMFYLLAIIFGFLALAFLIILLAISLSRGKVKNK